jgi:glycosyltransferase involved in cell wall biosynthesis
MAARFEVQQGFEVHRPWFLCFPGVLKRTDGLLLALFSFLMVRRLVRKHGLNLIDAHFGYPDGYAATRLGRWLNLPVMITLRGKEERQARTDVGRGLRNAIRRADRVVCVSDALAGLAVNLGADPSCVSVIGNGVDLEKFKSMPQDEARRVLGLPASCRVLVSVGTLVERKGFHRVIEVLPTLLRRFPDLHYLVIGGSGPEGDMSAQLKAQVARAGLESRVHFLGAYAPERLKIPYSAADVFVLATGYEGWANVFLEAMACGLPVITTRVGGNAQVVNSEQVGTLVELGDREALAAALGDALTKAWDREAIRTYAAGNGWDRRIATLLNEIERVAARGGKVGSALASGQRV